MVNLSFVFTIVTFLFSLNVSADSLPRSFHNSCKVTALEQMFDWLKGKDFYTIETIEESEGTIPSGEPAFFLKINFQDSKGCKNRQMIADCISLPEDIILAQMGLTDCNGKIILSSQVKF